MFYSVMVRMLGLCVAKVMDLTNHAFITLEIQKIVLKHPEEAIILIDFLIKKRVCSIGENDYSLC